MRFIKSNIVKPIIQLVMVMLFVYPMVFSFAHYLGHHFNQPEHKHQCCHVEEVHAESVVSNHHDESRCPLLEYQLALAIEPIQSALPSVGFKIFSTNSRLESNFTSSWICSLFSPRAPPFVG